MAPKLSRPLVVIAACAAAAIAVAAAALFQPWQLFVDTTVSDAPPSAVAAPAPESTPTPGRESPSIPPASRTPPEAPAKAEVLRQGRLISHEHETSGAVKIIQQPDGSRLLRIEDLDTTSGPDLRVWLTAAPVIAGRAGWFVFDDHPYRELGKLKGNRGDQNYGIPSGTDLKELENAVIWCRRFHVSFGAAELTG